MALATTASPVSVFPASAAVPCPPTTARSAALRTSLQDSALRAGFHLSGIASLSPQHPASAADSARFADWVASGHAGEMQYLTRRTPEGALVRADPQLSMPWARSVIVCALDYHAPGTPRSIDPAPPGAGWIARYAWSGRSAPAAQPSSDPGTLLPADYHDELLTRLRRIESDLHILAPACTTRCYVDTGPLLERGLAARAGIGWIGKNTCVLNQQRGSWLLLGVIVTSLELEPPPALSSEPRSSQTRTQVPAPAIFALPADDRCGTCTRCIDACPTQALLATRSPQSTRAMDATRCIAYLTIEKKGALPEDLRAGIGRQVFGCDICQDVCPWNRKAATSPVQTATHADPPALPPRPDLINPPLSELAALDAPAFKRRFRGSPLERTGRRRLLRNVAVAMGNSGDPAFLPQLSRWAESPTAPTEAAHIPTQPGDPILRDTAAWARDRILARAALPEASLAQR